MKRKRHRANPVDFFRVLKTCKTVLIHPVMEPGREVFSLNAVEDICERKGPEHTSLLLDEKLAFFFRHIPSKKIQYREFSSPFAASYKELGKQLTTRSYDVYIELNQFSEDIMTLFGSIVTSKVQMCIGGSRENPLFNMVIAAGEHYDDLDRSNLILKPLGIKKARKKFKWKKPAAGKKKKKVVALAPENERLGLQWYALLKNQGFEPVLFVTEARRIEKMKQKAGVHAVSIYPIEKAYEVCESCASFVVSVNPIFSIAYLLKRKTLLVSETAGAILPSDGHPVEVISPMKDDRTLVNRIKSFVEGK
jgi:hypothetical protein